MSKTQDKLLRLLNNTNLNDRIPTKEILKNLNMLLVNPMNAQIKLTEMWKMANSGIYPPEIKKMESEPGMG